MDLRLFSLRWPPLALAVWAVVSAVDAQSTATNAWKPIIFSSPDNHEVSSNLKSLSTQPVAPANLQGLFQDTSPLPSFNDFGPAPVPDTGRRIHKSANEHQDWVFMTPAEIMGVAPDQLSRDRKRDTNDKSENLSPMERYLARQNPSARLKNNSPDHPFGSRNFWEADNGQTNGDNNDGSDQNDNGLADPRLATAFNPSASGAPDNNLLGAPNTDSPWSKASGDSASPWVPNSVQQRVDLEQAQFQQLLNPGAVPVTAATSLPERTTSLNAQSTVLGSDSTEPLVNPIGASFTPISSGIGRPVGLAPLPGITGPASIPAITTPAWAPQPAPWTSQTPQPFAIPQRKF
ncbi:MAG: hypothetical protein ABSC24_04005 [Verrucomicrobiota bacterium]|jgi:hypothetical protein